MFEQLKLAPKDPILGLSETFREDPRPGKINLAVGVYQDASGKTPILESVRRAGRQVIERQSIQELFADSGLARFCRGRRARFCSANRTRS